jgi:hypothetical protein
MCSFQIGFQGFPGHCAQGALMLVACKEPPLWGAAPSQQALDLEQAGHGGIGSASRHGLLIVL